MSWKKLSYKRVYSYLALLPLEELYDYMLRDNLKL